MSVNCSRAALRPLRSHLSHAAPRSVLSRCAPPARTLSSIGARPAQAQPTPLVQDPASSTTAHNVIVHVGGQSRAIDSVFLRDSCTCTRCVDPDSKQKLFQTSDIPSELHAASVTVKDNAVEIEWTNDIPGYTSHRSRHSLPWLQQALSVESHILAGKRVDGRVRWDHSKIIKDNKWVDFQEYMTSDSALYDALTCLQNYGLLFLRNVPDSEKSVEDIGGRIGVLKDTFYGRTWDVKSKPNAKNIAYTHVFLGLHMDLLYTSNPPYLQFLHSLRARTPGGESLFSDSLHAAEQIRRSNPDQFKTLCTFPITYHYHNDSQHYHFTRPTIELFPGSQDISRINWSPPFQAPFQTSITAESSQKQSLREYLEAANAFEKLLASPDNLYEYKLEEGDCVVFDNRRVLHARRAFDASKGERWLKGAYIDDDVFFSRLRVLREKFEGDWVVDGAVKSIAAP